EELVRRNTQAGRLRFSADIPAAVKNSLVVFIAVGTNASPDGAADLSQVWSAADSIADHIEDYKIVVIRSTVPVGTAAQMRERISSRLKQPVEFEVASNPEFLREGSAVEDFFHPDRIVIGSSSSRAVGIMKDIYRHLYLIETPFVITTSETAELIKYAANSFLALKISFANELANLCDAIGPSTDVHVVIRALGLDRRIGPKFLHPGPGFGGSCLPKDTRAFCSMAGVSNSARIPTRLLKVLTRWWSRPSGMNFASWTSRSSKNKCGATCSWTPRTFLIWPKPGKRDSATTGSGGGRL